MLHLLRNASVFAPTPLGAVDILLAGGQIAAIGPKLSAPSAGWPVEEHDLSGYVIVPGLVDLHAHLGGGGGEGGAHTRVPPLQLTALSLAGVTTTVGLLGTDGTTRSLADLLAVARGLEHFGVTALCYTGSYEVPPHTLTGSVRGDIVHVDRIVAVGELALSDHRSSQPTLDELLRVGADAHVAGMMTGKAGVVHLHMGDGPRGLDLIRQALATEIPARTWHPTHCNRNHALWAEAKDLTKRGCFIDVTTGPDDEHGPGAVTAILDYLRSGYDPARLTLSSDGGGCFPDFDADGVLLGMGVGSPATLLDTVRGLVAAGLPLNQALAPCTATAATLFRLHTKGRVAVGADADLVVLDQALNLRSTIANGRFLVRDGAPIVHGMFERPDRRS